MEAALEVPLLVSQIDAANRLHLQLLQWSISDKALSSLQVCFPGFGMEATLLKVIAVNQLYGTQVYAVIPMARHITEIMPSARELETSNLVEQLASFLGRKHLSFASKFAHFFIDMERFPIYDSFAREMVTYHLGKRGQVPDTDSPYKAFLANIERLKMCAHLSCSNKELDRYLWLAGLYRKWKRGEAKMKKDGKSGAKVKMNVEVAELFKALSSVKSVELTQFQPDTEDLSS